jgi:type III secretion protein U
MSDKTEQPTEKKKREAQKQGQVARSRHFSASASGWVALLAASSTLVGSAREVVGYTRSALLNAVELSLQPAQALAQALHMLVRWGMPALVAAMLAGTVATALQVGIQFNLEGVQPKLERLDLSQGFKKLFSARNLIEVARSLIAFVMVAAIVWSALRESAPALARLASLEALSAMSVALGLVKHVAVKAAFTLFALGGLDLLYQRYQHQQSLMMTKEEVKQEHKNSEGDPHQKAKRKKLAKELLSAAGARGVKGATTVVVNPTHIAVALRYDTKLAEAPLIAARGRDEEAFAIRREAKRHGVPIVKDIPLARALINLQVGDEVPEELYQAVAGVLKVVIENQASAEEKTP